MEKYLEAPWMKARTTYPVWVLKNWSPGAEQGEAADNRLLQWRKEDKWAPDWRPARAVALAARAAAIKSKVESLTLERSPRRSSGIALSRRPARAGESPRERLRRISRSEDQTARAVPRPLERPVSRLTRNFSTSLGLSFGLDFNPRFLLSLLVFISF